MEKMNNDQRISMDSKIAMFHARALKEFCESHTNLDVNDCRDCCFRSETECMLMHLPMNYPAEAVRRFNG